MPNLLDEKSAKRMARGTGFSALRITPNNVTTADLVEKAAEPILACEQKDEIGALVFVSQTPDFVLPSTGHILQNRLGLGHDTLCIDISEGCSGYITGIYNASLLAKQLNKKVLFLCGDTISKLTSIDDRATRCIFGDAGTATLIEPGDEDIVFSFSSYGEKSDAIIVENSGQRKVPSPKNGGCLYLDGSAIMEFAVNETLEEIKKFIYMCGLRTEQITLFACHQANKVILNSLAEGLGVLQLKIPFTAEKIGNESSASIPLVLSQKSGTVDLSRVLCVGFGVGLSIGIAMTDFSKTRFLGVSEL